MLRAHDVFPLFKPNEVKVAQSGGLMWTSKETGDYTVWYSTRYHGSYHPVAKATIKSNKFKSYFS